MLYPEQYNYYDATTLHHTRYAVADSAFYVKYEINLIT